MLEVGELPQEQIWKGLANFIMETPQTPVMRAAIWSAVSSEEQARDDKTSIPNQLARGHAVAITNSWQVITELVVDGYSRNITRIDRAIQQVGGYQVVNAIQKPCKPYGVLCDLIESKAIDVLIYFDMDRLGRKGPLGQTILQLCRDFGVKYYDITNPTPFDAQATEGAMYNSAFGGIRSQVYVERLMTNHRDGMIRRAQQGKLTGPVSWGYAATYATSIDGKRILQGIDVDPVLGPLIRNMFVDWYLGQGNGYHEIANRLNSMAIPSPTGLTWDKVKVRAVFARVWRYAGFSEINKRGKRPYTKAPGNWPAIITESEAEAIEKEIAYRRNARRSVSNTYLLSGVVWCGHCNQRMVMATTVRSRPTKRLQLSLRCNQAAHAKRHLDGTPMHAFISVARVLEAIKADFVDLQNEAVRSEIVASQQGQRNEALQSQIIAIDGRVRQLKDSQKKIDVDYYVNHRIDAERHELLSAEIEKQLSAATTQRKALEAEHKHQKAQDRFADTLADTAAHGLTMLASDNAKTANAWLRQRIKVYVELRQVVRIEYSGLPTE